MFLYHFSINFFFKGLLITIHAMGKKQRVISRLKPAPYTLVDLSTTLKNPQISPATEINNGETTIQLYSTPDLPNNKRGFKYVPCRPNPYLDSILYSTTDLPPYYVHWSYFDRSPEMFVNENMTIVGTQNNDGWRSSRSNVGIREGTWYIEYKIINGIKDQAVTETENDRSNSRIQDNIELSRSVTPTQSSNNGNYNMNLSSHVRMGIARREASLEAPVGFDGYGYGIRDIDCEKIHLSRRSEITNDNSNNNKFKGLNNENLKIGDIIGLLIELPSMELQKKIARSMILEETLSDPKSVNEESSYNKTKRLQNSFIEKGIEREMIPIKYKGELFFEQYEYTNSKAMEHLLNPVTVFGEHAIPDKERFQPAKLPNSSITLYVNGEKIGKPFENLFAFLPPASEQRMARTGGSKVSHNKKQPDESFIIDHDDGELGYYPMVSCFRGGAVEINSSNNIWKTPPDLKESISKGEVKPYGELVKHKTVNEYVFDLVDNAVNTYLDKKELELL